ncbi:MAG: hypothetical protein IT384_15250 [Deltaproteobacteria bacterium]|nr:hypothetical protein [Deltaproteobacteria bacterium]
MQLPFRRAVSGCIHPETYKYFLAPDAIEDAWAALSAAFGDVRAIPGVGLRQIDSEHLIIRSVSAGNPITVIRARRCTAEDVARLHAILGYQEDS